MRRDGDGRRAAGRGAVGMALAAALAGCAGGGPGDGTGEVLVVVSAPLTTEPWVGRFAERGAQLAASQPGGRRVRVEVLDNGGSPQRAVANARRAVAEGAAALIIDGVGAVAVAAVTDPASLPVFIVFEGGEGLVDPKSRPTLFRLAPANRPLATRLADYLSEHARRVALISDDSSYGREGAASMRVALERDQLRLDSDTSLSAGSGEAATQVLAARRSGAQAVVVWARAAGVAAVVRAARAAGWAVPVYAGPTGEDPLVRQRLADHPEWVEGLTFVSFRITSETGPAPFAAYRKAYESRFGADRVGVWAGGRPVLAPPDWSMYSYDAVRLVSAALKASGGRTGQPLLAALESTVVTGANGDERGFGPGDREGVSPDDMYFGRFHDLRFAPVTDDILSTGLPAVSQ